MTFAVRSSASLVIYSSTVMSCNPINLTDMKKSVQLFSLLVLAFLPLSASAQGMPTVGDMDTYVLMLDEECPIDYGEAWAVMSIIMEGDTVHAVLQTPASLAGFLPMLTGDDEKVRRMWFKQLKSFGHPWNDLFDRLSREAKTLVITFSPKGGRATPTINYSPEDIAELTGKEQQYDK